MYHFMEDDFVSQFGAIQFSQPDRQNWAKCRDQCRVFLVKSREVSRGRNECCLSDQYLDSSVLLVCGRICLSPVYVYIIGFSDLTL